MNGPSPAELLLTILVSVAAVVLIFRAAAKTPMRSLRAVFIVLGIVTAIVLAWNTVAMFMR